MTMITIALVGNPNCGKTTLQNFLTGSNYQTGNWSGVTVEEQRGSFCYKNSSYQVIDLPGIYSLAAHEDEGALDAKIAREFITKQKIDVIVNVVNANNLQRHLYLTIQLLEMQIPVIVVVNMLDKAQVQGVELDLNKFSQLLHCPVLPMLASPDQTRLQDAIASLVHKSSVQHGSNCFTVVPYVKSIRDAIEQLSIAILPSFKPHAINRQWLTFSLLEGDMLGEIDVDDTTKQVLAQMSAHWREKIVAQEGEDVDILLADARYRLVQNICTACLTKKERVSSYYNVTKYLDHIVLNKWLGLPIFLLVMYVLFVLTIELGGKLQDCITHVSETYLITNLYDFLQQQGCSLFLTVLLTQGLGRGLITTITFMPVLGALFFYMALLEESGYMSRAVFVIDRIMRAFGLPGKAFVPMIIGFSCNVPAVLAARTLEQQRDRILTIMISPFMSCGARLAIYAVFTAAFFPEHGALVVFALYLIGIVAAMLTGLVLRKTFLIGSPDPLVMEFAEYNLPKITNAVRYTVRRMWSFIIRAGRLIVPLCVMLGILQSFSFSGAINDGSVAFPSILSVLGRFITPLFAPLGITSDNWPAVIGLLSGAYAKEVVVGTLNTLYAQLGSIHGAVQSLADNNQYIYGVMYKYFTGKVGAFSYLLFVLLYFPCISTVAVMLRELNLKWVLFSVFWTTLVAYSVAVIFYQAATVMHHIVSSVLWIGGIIMIISIASYCLKLLCQTSQLK